MAELTEREREIIALIEAGKTNAEVIAQMRCSSSTITKARKKVGLIGKPGGHNTETNMATKKKHDDEGGGGRAHGRGEVLRGADPHLVARGPREGVARGRRGAESGEHPSPSPGAGLS